MKEIHIVVNVDDGRYDKALQTITQAMKDAGLEYNNSISVKEPLITPKKQVQEFEPHMIKAVSSLSGKPLKDVLSKLAESIIVKIQASSVTNRPESIEITGRVSFIKAQTIYQDYKLYTANQVFVDDYGVVVIVLKWLTASEISEIYVANTLMGHHVIEKDPYGHENLHNNGFAEKCGNNVIVVDPLFDKLDELLSYDSSDWNRPCVLQNNRVHLFISKNTSALNLDKFTRFVADVYYATNKRVILHFNRGGAETAREIEVVLKEKLPSKRHNAYPGWEVEWMIQIDAPSGVLFSHGRGGSMGIQVSYNDSGCAYITYPRIEPEKDDYDE